MLGSNTIHPCVMIETKNAVPSPCVRNCCLTDDNICLGCFRNLDEICQWSQMDNATRLQVLSNAKQRRNIHSNQFRLNNGLISITPTINK